LINVIEALEDGHKPLVIVQVMIFEPGARLFTVVDGLVSSTKVAADDAVHLPEPTVALLPWMIAVLVHNSLSAINGNTIDDVVGKSLVIVTLAVLVQVFLVTVHVNVLPPEPRLVILVVAELAVIIVPEPPPVVHSPVPGNGLSASIL